MARFLEKLVPEARMGVVHGQMKPREIEDIMARFVRGDIDVLVCTSIIGSGLDIPTANTIIIQPGGPVRSGAALPDPGEGRTCQGRGGGLPAGAQGGHALAGCPEKTTGESWTFPNPVPASASHSSDLDIREVEISWGRPSPAMFPLWVMNSIRVNEKTIRELRESRCLKRDQTGDQSGSAGLYNRPNTCLTKHQRLVTYKRISLAVTEEELSELRGELTDLYGFIPPEVDNLFEVIRIKNLLKSVKGKRWVMMEKACSSSSMKKVLSIRQNCLSCQEKDQGHETDPDYKLYLSMPKSHRR